MNLFNLPSWGQLALPCCLVLAALGHHASGAPIKAGSATYEYFNSFFVRFPSNSPLYPDTANIGNPSAPPIDVEVKYTGRLAETREEQVGDTIHFEVDDIFGTGDLGGVPFELRGGLSAPELGKFLGAYTNVVQDANDPGFSTGALSSLASAFRRASGPFAQILNPGTPNAIYLYGLTPYVFESTVTGLPHEPGVEFLGAVDTFVDVRLRIGSELSPNDPIVGQVQPLGYVKILRQVPEPGGLLGIGMACAAMLPFRKRQFSPPCSC